MGSTNRLRAAVSVVLLLANAATADTATSGDLSVISFNVAGLPDLIQDNDQSGDKATNTELIGTYFAEYDFDVIHVQEDFNYHAYLCECKQHSLPTSILVLTSAQTRPTTTPTAPLPRAARPSAPGSTRSPTSPGSTSRASSGTSAPTTPTTTA